MGGFDWEQWFYRVFIFLIHEGLCADLVYQLQPEVIDCPVADQGCMVIYAHSSLRAILREYVFSTQLLPTAYIAKRQRDGL